MADAALPKNACRECLLDLTDMMTSTPGNFIKCTRCHHPACYQQECCGNIPTGDTTEQPVCLPCFRQWCRATKEQLGTSAAAHLLAITGFPHQLVDIAADGMCLFRGILHFFRNTISLRGLSSTSTCIAVTPLLVCQFITHEMTKAGSDYWPRLRTAYVDFSEGTM